MLGILGFHSDVNRENNFFFLFPLQTSLILFCSRRECGGKHKKKTENPSEKLLARGHSTSFIQTCFSFAFSFQIGVQCEAFHYPSAKAREHVTHQVPYAQRDGDFFHFFVHFIPASHFLHHHHHHHPHIICPCRDPARFGVIFMKNYPQ